MNRLRRDASGNTMAMMAMATIPLAGLAGSAVDIGRGYLVRARLQQACDAGALAARRSMVNNTLDSGSRVQGERFFATNFATDTAGATNTAFTITGNAANGEITGTATTRLPMTVTRILGKENVDLNVTCSSRLEIPNTDVMFVLDTTGSMNCIPSDVNSTGTCDGGAASKIVGIRAAVLDFYDTMATSVPPGAQLRYGFVPYSSTVNVGNLLGGSWVPDAYSYRSRVANFTTRVDPTNVAQSQTLSAANCTNYQAHVNYPTLNGASSASTDAAGFTTTVTVSASPPGYSGGVCYRNLNTVVSPTAYRHTNFTYRSESYDITRIKSGQTVDIATGTPSTTVYVGSSRSLDMAELAAIPTYAGGEETTSGTGCIEERDTVANATFSYATLPTAAYDLDIDRIPNSDQTRWRPMWPEVIWAPAPNAWSSSQPRRPIAAAANGFTACPSRASFLGVMTRSAVQTYVNNLVPIGGTYHDVGMIWGARLLSPTGPYAMFNATAPNGQPINRNIIFMTDGQMAPNQNIYGLYGFEALDQRVSGGALTELTARHNSRFRAMCDAARAKNMRVWVVGFGTALSADMIACADPNQAFQADNTATLRARFAQIANQVARLRLSQ